jgi:hypothetical protein
MNTYRVFAGQQPAEAKEMTADEVVEAFPEFRSTRGDVSETVDSLQPGEAVIGIVDGRDVQIGRAE